MSEYLTEAIVLKKEPAGEYDARVLLYSDTFGKIWVKIKSGRKITSKLNNHLEPLNRALVRIIEIGPGRGFQAVDALRFGKLSNHLTALLLFLDKTSEEREPDARLWKLLKSIPDQRDPLDIKILFRKMLDIGGFNADLSSCNNCGRVPSTYFIFQSANFSCSSCFRYSEDALSESISI